MDNNKNRMKDREKSNPELRKMKPKANEDVGLSMGVKLNCMTEDMKKTEIDFQMPL